MTYQSSQDEIKEMLSDTKVLRIMIDYGYNKSRDKFDDLSMLSTLLTSDSLLNLIIAFEGTTIKIPTLDEITELVLDFYLYEKYEIEGLSLEEIQSRLSVDITLESVKSSVDKVRRYL